MTSETCAGILLYSVQTARSRWSLVVVLTMMLVTAFAAATACTPGILGSRLSQALQKTEIACTLMADG